MQIAATLLALVGSAAAFAPAAEQSRVSSALAAEAKPFSDELGAMMPVSSSVRYRFVECLSLVQL